MAERAAVVADRVVEFQSESEELRHEHAVVAPRDDAELVARRTPLLDGLQRLLVDLAAPEERPVVIACSYLHCISSS